MEFAEEGPDVVGELVAEGNVGFYDGEVAAAVDPGFVVAGVGGFVVAGAGSVLVFFFLVFSFSFFLEKEKKKKWKSWVG